MSEKLCVFCNHLTFEGEGYGDYAESAKFVCLKGKWARKEKSTISDYIWKLDSELRFGDGEQEFRKLILRAGKCADYDEAKP